MAWTGQRHRYRHIRLRPQLVAGNTYWLVATVPDMLNDALVWGHSTNSQGRQTYYKYGVGPWFPISSTEATFQINGTQFLQPTISATATDSVTIDPGPSLVLIAPSKAPSGAPAQTVSAFGQRFVSGAR